jgi:hypothetical protein
MLVPVLLATAPAAHAAHGHDAGHALMVGAPGLVTATEVAAVAVHTGAMYLTMAAVALLVFEKIGLAVLRRAWLNLDRAWAIALVSVGAATALA